MAIGNTTQLAAIIRDVYDDAFATLISRDEFLLMRFPHVKGAGKKINWKVQDNVLNTSAASYAEGASLPTAQAHAYLDANLTWRYVWAVVEVTGQAIAQTDGEGGFKKALSSEMDESMLDLRNQINTYLLGNTGTATDIDGIRTVLTNSGTYAALAVATYARWAPYVNANGGTPRALTLALMQDVKTTVEEQPRNGRVSVILTGATQYNNYGNLLTSQRRFVNTQSLDGGFLSLDFEGVPVVKVPNYPTGRMDFLTEKDKKGQALFQYRVLRNFDTQDKSQTVADGAKFVLYHYANLQLRSRKEQGSLQDLS